jgi:hypothetical protein
MTKKKIINFKATNKPIKKDTKSKNVSRKKIRGRLLRAFNTYFLKYKKDFEQKVKNNKINNENEDGIVDGGKVTIDDTLANYRRLYHLLRVHKIVYFRSSHDLKCFEDGFNRMCEQYKIALGDEQFTSVSIDTLVGKLDQLILLLNYSNKITFETKKNINKYNSLNNIKISFNCRGH